MPTQTSRYQQSLTQIGKEKFGGYEKGECLLAGFSMKTEFFSKTGFLNFLKLVFFHFRYLLLSFFFSSSLLS